MEGFSVTESASETQQVTYNIVLESEPTANVTVDIGTFTGGNDDLTLATVSPTSVTFTPDAPSSADPMGAKRWNDPHSITVSIANDDIDRANAPIGGRLRFVQVFHEFRSSDSDPDSGYNVNVDNTRRGSLLNFPINITDDDIAGVTITDMDGMARVSTTPLTVAEGASQNYGIKLM